MRKLEEQEAVKAAEEVAMKEPLMSNSTSAPYRKSNKNKNNSETKEFRFHWQFYLSLLLYICSVIYHFYRFEKKKLFMNFLI